MIQHDLQKEKVKNVLSKVIREFYPDFSDQVIKDCTHLVAGNAMKVAKRKKLSGSNNDGPEIVDHQEQVIGLGTGFDWLHKPNFAIIVNPFAIDLEDPFVVQLKVILGNLLNGRIPKEDGVVIMISTSYFDPTDKPQAELKAIALVDFVIKTLKKYKKDFGQLDDYGLQIIVGTLDRNTRLFEPIEQNLLNKFSKSGYTTPAKLNKIGEFIYEHNRKQHREFITKYNSDLRKEYRESYPTEILGCKCGDGRPHLADATETPFGIIQPYRNIGGNFHFGWKGLYDEIKNCVDYAANQKRRTLLFALYHLSKIDDHLGCAGHNYDTCAAKKSVEEFIDQGHHVFGRGPAQKLNFVLSGYNTDTNALILHGEREGQILDMDDFVEENQHLFVDELVMEMV